DATVDSLGVGADRNGILMVIVATSVAHVINMTSAVFVISNTVINLFGNHLIDSILTDSIGNSIHHNCDFIINFVAIDIFSLFQSLNIADVPNSNAIDRIITNSNLQTIVNVIINRNRLQLVRNYVLRHNIQHARILDSILQISIQIAAILEGNVLRNFVVNFVEICGNASFNSCGNTVSTRLNRISGLLGIDIGVLAADRKSTRLNSSHVSISYAVFCLKKKTTRTCILNNH